MNGAHPRLDPSLVLLLSLPPLLWAGNAVVGRALIDSVPPLLLNTLRWLLALALLWPFTADLWAGRAQWRLHWRWWLIGGVLGMGSYNSLQYMALHSSSALNVTLIAASLPLAMLLIGRLFFAATPRLPQLFGALLALAGVLVVVSQGQWQRLLALQAVPGDLLMLLATLCWAGYSWLLTRRPAALADWPWQNLLATQMLFGLAATLPLTVAEQCWTAIPLRIDTRLLASLAYIAVGPSLLAYRCWAVGVARGGPQLAGVFINLTPVFAALLSLALLGETPQGFHAVAFLLIAAGIGVAARAS
ncbi:DMT family transporter [Inhella sp.]|uniref:DMT family transporter n=1 Tax=Inhella sp. TaxID=1921806 RepID=UPI0035AE5A12